MILEVLIRIRKYSGLLWSKNEIFMTLPMKASHSFQELHLVWPENPQWFCSWIKQQKILFFHKLSIK